jgi:hypothetical protein
LKVRNKNIIHSIKRYVSQRTFILYFSLFIFNFQFSILYSQVVGTATYSFLDLTPSAQVAALGGKVNAMTDSELSLAFYNPGLLDSTANHHISLNFVDMFADIRFGYAAYSRSYRNIGNFAAGIHYINYGKFIAADEAGIITGDFTAAEYAFNLTYSRLLPWLDSTLLVGINVKPLLSVFERYTSYGLLVDLGITYRHPNKFFTAALVLRNMGGQITPYSDGGREPVPFELQLGMSQKLQYAPFRISVLVQHLERPKLGYNEVNINPAPGQKQVKEEDLKKGFDLVFDETMRHLIVGVECFPFHGLILRASYNYNRRQEMKVDTRPGMVGFSWGLGIHLSRFSIDYARSAWHLSGASDHISVSVRLR